MPRISKISDAKKTAKGSAKPRSNRPSTKVGRLDQIVSDAVCVQLKSELIAMTETFAASVAAIGARYGITLVSEVHFTIET